MAQGGRRAEKGINRLSALLISCLISSSCSWSGFGGDRQNAEAIFQAIRNDSRRGEFRQANQRAEQAYASWKSRPDAEWHWKFKLLYSELLLLDGQTRKAKTLLAAPPPSPFAGLHPRYDALLGYVAYREGRDAEAESLLKNAAEAAHSASDFELEADAGLIQATYASPEQSETMEKLIAHILQIGREHDLSYQMAAADLDYGMLRVHQSRFAEAIPHFDEAARMAEKAGATMLYSIAVGDQATCYYNVGDFDQALALRKNAIDTQKRAGLNTALRDSYLELGASQYLQGQSPQAIESFRQALSLVNAADSPEPYQIIACNLASALESAGALDEAEQLNQRALAAIKGTDQEAMAAVKLNEAAIAQHRGQGDEAIAKYQEAIALSSRSPSLLWSGYAALGSAYARAGRVGEAERNFENAIRTVEANRAEQLQSQYKITFLSRLISLYQEYVELLVSQHQESRALAVADSSRAGVLTQNLIGTKAASDGDLVERLRKISRQSKTVFLFYWLAPKCSYLWVLDGEGLKTIPLPDGGGIAEKVKSYRYLLEQEKIDPIASPHRLPSELYQQLVAPAARWIPKGAPVVIVPDDALHGLNFESLIVADPEPHYWLKDATVSIAPSLGVVTAVATHATAQRPSLLLFGDPETGGTGYPKLPNAGSEMDRVGKYFTTASVTVRRGAEAVPGSYRSSQPQRFSAIHFATHAEANEKSPLDSAIILSNTHDGIHDGPHDGFRLYAREITETPITADLVTLSACRGAGARTLSGEGMVGFAWAFFQAGAQNVVASLWDVNDRSTSDLMDIFYGRVKEGLPYAEALRQAKLAMLQTEFRKPYYWAPFQLYRRNIRAR